jgi:predicted ATPase
MITKLRVQNLKCLRDVTLELGPLTVLIGPNDSGKSSLLDAIHLLGRTAQGPTVGVFQGATNVGQLLWRHESTRELILCAEWSSENRRLGYEFAIRENLSYRETVGVEGRTWLQKHWSLHDTSSSDLLSPAFRIDEQDTSILRAPQCTALYSLANHQSYRPAFGPFTSSLRTPGRYHLSTDALRAPSVPEPGAVLSPSGDNLASIVDAILSGPDLEVRAAFEGALRATIPTLKGVTTPPAAGDKPGAKEMHFVLAGTMLVTAFLALAYGPTPDLLLIEEPENGLHPARVGDIMALLRRMSRGEVGDRRRQIIVTTHNPLFLNQAEPEEVRIVQRDPETGTRVTPLTEVKDIGDMLKDFGIGELWALLGEKGLVEGATP